MEGHRVQEADRRLETGSKALHVEVAEGSQATGHRPSVLPGQQNCRFVALGLLVDEVQELGLSIGVREARAEALLVQRPLAVLLCPRGHGLLVHRAGALEETSHRASCELTEQRIAQAKQRVVPQLVAPLPDTASRFLAGTLRRGLHFAEEGVHKLGRPTISAGVDFVGSLHNGLHLVIEGVHLPQINQGLHKAVLAEGQLSGLPGLILRRDDHILLPEHAEDVGRLLFDRCSLGPPLGRCCLGRLRVDLDCCLFAAPWPHGHVLQRVVRSPLRREGRKVRAQGVDGADYDVEDSHKLGGEDPLPGRLAIGAVLPEQVLEAEERTAGQGGELHGTLANRLIAEGGEVVQKVLDVLLHRRCARDKGAAALLRLASRLAIRRTIALGGTEMLLGLVVMLPEFLQRHLAHVVQLRLELAHALRPLVSALLEGSVQLLDLATVEADLRLAVLLIAALAHGEQGLVLLLQALGRFRRQVHELPFYLLAGVLEALGQAQRLPLAGRELGQRLRLCEAVPHARQFLLVGLLLGVELGKELLHLVVVALGLPRDVDEVALELVLMLGDGAVSRHVPLHLHFTLPVRVPAQALVELLSHLLATCHHVDAVEVLPVEGELREDSGAGATEPTLKPLRIELQCLEHECPVR
mmetsp:Transcript_47694/g.102172  ORF Transcript_47694/g.102172 Transcript_47694/m.102172 type:complete len:640 (-) Transcript_47694:2017-3936(-)